MKEKILSWVAEQLVPMEECIVAAAKNYVSKLNKKGLARNLTYDLRKARDESFELANGADLCYDRFSTPLMYSMWYQGRRINTALPTTAEIVEVAIQTKQPIRIFDLGAGTGAVQIALGMCIEAAKQLGHVALPSIQLINVDTSPFMLNYGRSFLQPAFKERFPGGFQQIAADYETVSWTSYALTKVSNTYVIASYLFDHSERHTESGKQFEHLIKDVNPRYVVLLSDYNKRQVIDQFSAELDTIKYSVTPLKKTHVLKGQMRKLAAFRRAFDLENGFTFGPSDKLLWQEKSFYGCKVTPITQELGLIPNADLDLYQQPVRVRTDITLSEEQKDAAKPTGRRTIIVGPAGSGKSVVITERIKQLIKTFDYDQELHILLTTFNNDLTQYLQSWMKDLLDSSRISYSGKDNENYHFDLSPKPNLTILNFDKLPTRLANIDDHLIKRSFDISSIMQIAVNEVLEEEKITNVSDPRILDPLFLYQEFVRVVYGQKCLTRSKYLAVNRVNPPFRLFEANRRLVWKIISRFLTACAEGRPGWSKGKTVYHKRLDLYQELSNQQIPLFTHVFVDELQDCTEGDYQLFYGLLEDNDELVIAGDYAQAVHLGKTVRPPRAEGQFRTSDINRRFKQHNLAGSYRLPFRISECIRPLSEEINKSRNDLEVDILSPYRGAPPGARPIVVYARSEEAMAEKMAKILAHYQVYDQVRQEDKQRHTLNILEMDTHLSATVNNKYPDLATTDTILSLKGMEKDCIVWSTRQKVNSPGEEEYYVYTILTRTRSTLIIALFDNTLDRYKEIIKLFDKKRFIFWDYATEMYYKEQIEKQVYVAVEV